MYISRMRLTNCIELNNLSELNDHTELNELLTNTINKKNPQKIPAGPWRHRPYKMCWLRVGDTPKLPPFYSPGHRGVHSAINGRTGNVRFRNDRAGNDRIGNDRVG